MNKVGPDASFNVDEVVQRFNEENDRENRRLLERRAAAEREGIRLAERLREADPNIRRIWGFGSVFEISRPFTFDSDIDLAIEGGDILTLYSVTEDSSFDVDLVDITESKDGFARMIRERGKLLFG